MQEVYDYLKENPEKLKQFFYLKDRETLKTLGLKKFIESIKDQIRKDRGWSSSNVHRNEKINEEVNE